ncbi:uncharacterized protein LOC110722976 [Chenopodium quinoa]|uniref:uncharacterized protein LOC110722976 n=1 Tax=Chenopodium quinoa TaxID=63459 RepID=UPI000B777740|nr:uncharacterized protein LOC110722976 [Chenopodium quinoa]
MRRLKKKWNIRGELSLTDIGCDYYIARFTNQADYNYVLTQGPWLLDDNYLTIRKWIPNFVPDDGVDKTTAQAERGQFTRVSVEIDLSKPLLSKFRLKGNIWRVQYEGIRMVCFNCGKLGHVADDCKPQEVMANNQNVRIEENPLFKPNNKPEEAEDFVSWMLVKKPIRKYVPRQPKPSGKPEKVANGSVARGAQQSHGGGKNITEKSGQGQDFLF